MVKNEKRDVELAYKLFGSSTGIGDIYVLSRIGHGAMGSIYKGLNILKSESSKEVKKLVDIVKKISEIEDELYYLEQLNKKIEQDKQVFSYKEIKEVREKIAKKERELSKLYPLKNNYDLERICEENELDIKARLVAIKPFLEIRKEVDSLDKNIFFNEISMMSELLGTPNTVQFISCVEDKNGLWLTMEYVDGLSLKNILKDRERIKKEGAALKPELSAIILYFIAEGLANMHDKHIIHRDIKPGNIMIDYSGNLKIADFGIAIKYEPSQEYFSLGGTTLYSSPNVLLALYENKSYIPDYRDDIWSLGILGYEIITGVHPFVHVFSEGKVFLENIIKAEVPKIKKYNQNADEKIEKIIKKCIKINADERYQSCYDIMDDIYKYLVSKGIYLRDYKARLQELMDFFLERRIRFYDKLKENVEGTIVMEVENGF